MFLGSDSIIIVLLQNIKSVRSIDNIVVHSMVSSKILGVFGNPMRHEPMVFHIKLTTVGCVTPKTSLQSTAFNNALSPNAVTKGSINSSNATALKEIFGLEFTLRSIQKAFPKNASFI
jgi:hypothetical protein